MMRALAQYIMLVMRVLAQYIMRGRWQAATVALLGSYFQLIPPATVGLVVLRRGALEGLLVFLWAILPAIVALWAGNVEPLMAHATIAVMLVVLVAAAYLRYSKSWNQTLMLLVAASTLSALVLTWQTEDVTASLTESLGDLAVPAEPPDNESAGAEAESVPTLAEWSARAGSGSLAYLLLYASFLALLVGRWWQALLYNPGGLREEMHSLRLSPLTSLVSVSAVIWCLVGGDGYQLWARVFALPLVVAGVGLVHWVVKTYRLGLVTLIVFYAALVMLGPLLLLVASLAFADAWLNLRIRFKSTQS
jgi:hypothetical protein